jgi:hypothetical protein
MFQAPLGMQPDRAGVAEIGLVRSANEGFPTPPLLAEDC